MNNQESTEKERPIESQRAEQLGDSFLYEAFIETGKDAGYNESFEAELAIGQADIEKMTEISTQMHAELVKLITNGKEYMTEKTRDLFYDDKTRKAAFEALFLFGFTAANILGEQSGVSSESLRMMVASAPLLDDMLKYLYEVNNAYGKLEIYTENDSDITRKERFKFFLSDHVYDFLDHTIPKILAETITLMEKINSDKLSWETKHEAR